VAQIVTGVLLSLHYTAHIEIAFVSVEHIMRDINNGWLLRYSHANGASMFFIVVYIHTFRGLFYTSYAIPRQQLWNIGVLILLLMIITAFMGYVLPWGQMSFWGATVITNLVSAVPAIGNQIVIWLWGGYSIANATLTKFYGLHFFFPIIISFLVVLHLMYLHFVGSNNPLGITALLLKIFFAPYYIVKDLYGVFLFLGIFAFFVFFYPNLLGHPDNYIQANPLVTPPHIVPEWYFLPFYAILRSIPDKLLGVLALLIAICILLIIPFSIVGEIRSLKFKPLTRFSFWCFVMNCVALGWIGSQSVKIPFVEIGQFSTIFYFLFLILLLPLFSFYDKWIQQN